MSDAWSAPSGTGGGGSSAVGGVAQFPDIVRNASLIAKRGGGALVMAYGVVAVGLFVVQIPTWLFSVMISFDPENAIIVAGGAMANLCWSIVQLVLTLALTTLSTGLARVARTLVVDPDGVSGAGGMLKMASTRYFPVLGVLLITGILVGIGLCLCLAPGLIAAFFLSSAVYLVAATDIEFGAAFEKSYNLALANAPLLLAWFGAVFVVMMILFGVTFAVNFFFTFGAAILGPQISYDYAGLMMGIGQVIGPIFSAGLGAIIGYPLMVLSNAILVAIETADAGVPARE